MLSYPLVFIFLNLLMNNVLGSYYQKYFEANLEQSEIRIWQSEVDKKIEAMQDLIYKLENKLDDAVKSGCSCTGTTSGLQGIKETSDYTINLSNVTLKLYSNELKDLIEANNIQKLDKVNTEKTLADIPACYIDIFEVSSPLQPLMVTTSHSWPTFEIDGAGKMIVPGGEEFLLVCPKEFINFPNNSSVKASCAGGTKVLVDGVEHEYAEIQCTENVKHFLNKTGEPCLAGKSEIYKISFNLPNCETIDLYEICMEKVNNDPIYAKFTMQGSFSDLELSTAWSDSDQYGLDFNEAYGSCKNQTEYISNYIGRPFHLDGECCFALKQLVSYRDIFPGVAQRAAFSYVNTAALWSTCHGENWNAVEQRVRTLAKVSPNSLLVWTGVKFDELLEIAFGNQWTHPPFYLWKVVQDPGTKSSLAIIQVNVPDVSTSVASSEYKLCRDVCDQTEWMRGSEWLNATRGYTYCCTLQEFQEAFNFHIFEPHHESLLTGEDLMLHNKS